MSGFMFKYPDAFKWQCGRCENWNNVENGLCTRCKAPSQQFAIAFRLKNVLTAEEKIYYQYTSRSIVRELGLIRNVLMELTEEVKKWNKK